MSGLIVIFLKYPRPGRVKTRLAASLGDGAAAGVYRALVRETLRGIPPRSAVRICFDPPELADEVKVWLAPDLTHLPAVEFLPQASGDLGDRLADAFERAFRDGHSAVLAVGSDCIDLTAGHYQAAWDALAGGADLAIGPTPDGGYHLLATKDYQASLFRDIPWSTAETCKATLSAATKCGLETVLLEELADVDDADDFARVQNQLGISAEDIVDLNP